MIHSELIETNLYVEQSHEYIEEAVEDCSLVEVEVDDVEEDCFVVACLALA